MVGTPPGPPPPAGAAWLPGIGSSTGRKTGTPASGAKGLSRVRTEVLISVKIDLISPLRILISSSRADIWAVISMALLPSSGYGGGALTVPPVRWQAGRRPSAGSFLMQLHYGSEFRGQQTGDVDDGPDGRLDLQSKPVVGVQAGCRADARRRVDGDGHHLARLQQVVAVAQYAGDGVGHLVVHGIGVAVSDDRCVGAGVWVQRNGISRCSVAHRQDDVVDGQ